MTQKYLAFDLGASSGRAIIGTVEQGKLSLQEVHRFSNGPIEKDGSLFWDFNLQVRGNQNRTQKSPRD